MIINPPGLCPRRVHLIASTKETPPTLSPAGTFRLALASGAAAGFTVDAILFPLDTLKTRLQLATAPKTPTQLLTGLYAGFGPAVLASAPAAAAFFGAYDFAKRLLTERLPEKYAPVCHMIAAGIGDVAGSTVRAPFEVVKQRVQSGAYAGAGAAVRATITQEGLGGFFTGYGSLVIRELPFDAIQFPLYEYLKVVAKRKRGRELQTWETSICGSIAGGVSAAVTTPLDVVKTRLMTQNAAAPQYDGIMHGLRKIAAQEGPGALMSGLVPRVVWISVGGAVFFGAYEAARKVLLPILASKEQEKRKKV